MSNHNRPTHAVQGRAQAVARLAAYDQSREARIGSRVKILPSGCWQFGNRKMDDYAKLHIYGRVMPAHRWFYETLVGPIPEGHDVHHKCQVKGCVNPAHLEAMTTADHMAEHARLREVS